MVCMRSANPAGAVRFLRRCNRISEDALLTEKADHPDAPETKLPKT